MGIINILILIVFFTGVSIYEIRSLLKKSYMREIWIFSILMIIALVLGVYFALGLRIPLPKFPIS